MDLTEIEPLLVRYFNNELSSAEAEKVAAWIAGSEEHRKTAEHLYYINLAAEAERLHREIDPAEALRKVHRRIRSDRWHRTFHRLERIAAVLLLPFIVLSLLLASKIAEKNNSMVEIRSTTGMISAVTLPDNSRVWLNSNSKLIYPTRFSGKERRVKLCGEGYFEVTKDTKHKFVVEARSTEIEAYGTEFNVEAYNDEYIRATLVKGSIGMKYDDSRHMRQLVRLVPDQFVIYNSRTGAIYLDQANIASSTSWKEGKIVLDNTPLNDALRMIGNKYNVSFDIKDQKLLGNTFTGTFSNQSLDVILRYFTISSKLRFHQIGLEDGNRETDGRAIFEVY